MPLEHAEDLALQERCVALFEARGRAAPAESREPFDGYVGYARRHRDVIARYGPLSASQRRTRSRNQCRRAGVSQCRRRLRRDRSVNAAIAATGGESATMRPLDARLASGTRSRHQDSGSTSADDLRLARVRHHHGVPGPVQEPHPSGQGSHFERRVPRAAHAQGVRRLRRQYRVQPASRWRRTAATMATVGQDFQRVPRAFHALRHLAWIRSRDRRSLHRAGVHHHRSRRQPDHRVPPGRDDAVATKTTCAT